MITEQPSPNGETQPWLNIVLFQPEIPQNTGNIGRLCAFSGLRLHLIHPLGFKISEKHIRRSGMDYWKSLDLVEHLDWQAFLDSLPAEARVWLFTTKAKHSHWSVSYEPGDYLLFGNEGYGCPPEVHEKVGDERRIKIPQLVPGLRSLNLSTSVGIASYEALKSIKEIVNFTEY